MYRQPTREEGENRTIPFISGPLQNHEKSPIRIRIGVTCVPLLNDSTNGQLSIVMTTLPNEDFSPNPKRERLVKTDSNAAVHTTLHDSMLCVPSGAYSSTDGTTKIAMWREFKEEQGVRLNLQRLVTFPITHFVEQYRTDQVSIHQITPPQTTLFIVSGFFCELSHREFELLQLNASESGRTVVTLPVSDAAGFTSVDVRPATMAAIQAYAAWVGK